MEGPAFESGMVVRDEPKRSDEVFSIVLPLAMATSGVGAGIGSTLTVRNWLYEFISRNLDRPRE